MIRQPLSRRTLLRGLSGVAIALPFLEAMEAHAAAPATPKRFVFVFSANGTIPPAWTPSGSETSFQLGRILAPLEPHKSKLLLLDNLDMESAHHGPGDGHQKGMGHLLTGTELQNGDIFTGGDSEKVGWGGGISIDQEIAKRVGQNDRFPSLLFGVQTGGANIWSRMSYSGPGSPMPAEDNPRNAFNRIFANFNADPAGLAELRYRRHSVLDSTQEDFKKLRAQLGSTDLQKVDAHLTAIREIERRLDLEDHAVGASCVKPAQPATLDHTKNENFPAVGKLQMDLLVMALTCNLTKVATLQWSRSVSQVAFPWVGVTDRHHDLSHFGDSDAAVQEKITKINVWYAQQFAYLLTQMSKVQEGDRTLLDNTAVLWGNELGKGNSHSRRDVPFVMAGSCGGYFRTGRYLKYTNGWHNELYVSLLNAMGVQTNTFGNPAYCKGALPNLT
ncbi:Protein of unknown function [Stigmatella aurantiaca]|uniref:Tat (Twin-arginine translocation) pathway signal sequence domain protein n=1 Tax=Stigmatella aurantiaca TaxID=41 RepID=A0A1H7JWV6_STIAU|nr:DUF1552 domain-containing protein [Stigmatella aurantiaca]SEK78756.1 Protein of unknown function [Stigmatella aurantiaca]